MVHEDKFEFKNGAQERIIMWEEKNYLKLDML